MEMKLFVILAVLIAVAIGAILADICRLRREISRQTKERKKCVKVDAEHKNDVRGEKIDRTSGMKVLRPEIRKEAVSKLDTEPHEVDLDLMGNDRPLFSLRLPPDGLELHLRMPTKAVADRFEVIGRLLEKIEKGELNGDSEKQLYSALALIMSHNTERYVCTESDLARRLSQQDIADLLDRYMQWILKTVNEKN